jgi:ubiquinone/menaquinone biosynthesis C-methylase UbiE
MEFNKYEQRGAYHWKEYANKSKHAYGKHADKVKNWIRAGKTLDIGAGDGLITYLINAIGIDDNKIAVKLANEKGVNVVIGDAYNLNFPDNSFDNVFMGDVIEHLEFPDIAIKEVKRVLKTDGYFYIVIPPAKKDGLHDKYHYKEYTPNELIEYMRKNGFDIIGEIEVIKKHVRMYGIFKNNILVTI